MRKVFLVALTMFIMALGEEAYAQRPSRAQVYADIVTMQLLRMEGASPARILPLCKRILGVMPVPQAYVDMAHILLEVGDLKTAIDTLEEGAEKFPNDFTLQVLLGEIYGDVGKKNHALLHFDKALRINPKDERVYQRLIGLYVEEGNYEAANTLLGKWEKAMPHSVSLYLTWARVYISMGLSNRALEKLQDASREHPDNPDVFRLMGRLYELNGNTEGAIKAYKKLLELSPTSVDALGHLGELYIQEKKYPSALKIYRSLLKSHPGYPQLSARVASILVAMDRKKEALRTINDALKVHKDERLLFMKALLLEDMGRKGEALRLLCGVVAKGGTHDPSFYIQIASIYMDKGDRERAITVLRSGIMVQPDAPQLYKALAIVYNEIGKKEEALMNAAYAVVLRPHDPSYLFSLGALLERQGQWKKSEKFLKRALKLDPQNPSLLNYLGYMYIDRGVNLDEGISLVRKALAIRPNNPYYLDSLAWGLFKKGKLKRARQIQEGALRRIKEKNAIMLSHMGAIYMALGMKEKAKALYAEALRHLNNKELSTWEREEIIRSARALGLLSP